MVDKRPLRIGYVWEHKTADMHSYSATALHVKAVVRGLERRGHAVRMLTFQNGQPHWSDDLINWHSALPEPSSMPLKMIEKGTRFVQGRLQLPYANWFDSNRFATIVARILGDCDLIYQRFWFLGYGGLLAANRCNIPLVYEVNGDLVAEYQQLGIRLSSLQWHLLSSITRRMLENAAHVIPVSETLKQRTISQWKLRTDNLTAVANGAHVAAFAQPDSQQIAANRSRYQLDDAPVIIFVGSFKPWHGLDLLLDAFSTLATNQPTAKLLLVGDGPARAQLETMVQARHLQERVIFTGVVDHAAVPALLALADIAVLNPRVTNASRAQSPLKLYEYMAAGKAIVAPTIPTVEHVLTHQHNGLLIEPDHVDSLADALLTLLQNKSLSKQLGKAAQAQARSNHSWEHTLDQIETIFYRLAAATSAPPTLARVMT